MPSLTHMQCNAMPTYVVSVHVVSYAYICNRIYQKGLIRVITNI